MSLKFCPLQAASPSLLAAQCSPDSGSAASDPSLFPFQRRQSNSSVPPSLRRYPGEETGEESQETCWCVAAEMGLSPEPAVSALSPELTSLSTHIQYVQRR